MSDPTALIPARLSSGIAFALVKKAQDVEKEQGDAAVKLIEAAAKLQEDAARGAVSALPGPEESGASVDVTR